MSRRTPFLLSFVALLIISVSLLSWFFTATVDVEREETITVLKEDAYKKHGIHKAQTNSIINNKVNLIRNVTITRSRGKAPYTYKRDTVSRSKWRVAHCQHHPHH